MFGLDNDYIFIYITNKELPKDLINKNKVAGAKGYEFRVYPGAELDPIMRKILNTLRELGGKHFFR